MNDGLQEFSNAHATVRKGEARAAAVDAAMVELRAAIDRVGEILEQRAGRIAELERRLEAANARIEELEAAIDGSETRWPDRPASEPHSSCPRASSLPAPQPHRGGG